MPDSLPQGFPQVPEGQDPSEFLRRQAGLLEQQTQQSQQKLDKSLQTSPLTRLAQTSLRTSRSQGQTSKPSAQPSGRYPDSIRQALLAETKTQHAINAPYYKGELEKTQAGLALSEEDQKHLKTHTDFDNLSSQQKQDRIAQLKDPKINPLLVPNAYDGLNAALHKWTMISKSAVDAKVSGEAQERVANNYYDKVLVPLYQRLGATPISRQLWQREAYAQDGAMTFDIDDRYMNGGMKGIGRGLTNTIQMVENIGETGVNLLGFGLKEGWAAAKAGVKGQFFETGDGSWLDNLHKVAQQNPDMFEAAKKDTRAIPILRSISKALDDRTMQWWSESVPARNATEWTTSAATEMVAQAGIFKALGTVNEAGVVATGLTEKLAAVPMGKFVIKRLMAGAEGSIFGLTTRPQEDRHKWIEDGISFMVTSAILEGLTKAGSLWVERFKASGGLDVLKEKADQFGDRFKNKTRPLDGAEQDVQMLGAKANEMSVVGAMGSHAIDEQGLKYANDWAERGLNSKQINAEKRALKRKDPALYERVVASVDNINRIIGKEPILDIMADPKKVENLRAKLALIRNDAADKMVEDVPEVKQAAIQEAAQEARKPGAAKLREQIKADLMKAHPDIIQALKTGNITQEEFDKRIDLEYAKRSVEGGVEASKQARKIKNASRDAAAVGKKRTAIQAAREAATKAGTATEAAKPPEEAPTPAAKPKPSPAGKPKPAEAPVEAQPAATGSKKRGTLRALGWSDGAIDRMSPEEAQKIASAGTKPEPMVRPSTAAPEGEPESTKVDLGELGTIDRQLFDATKAANADPANKWKEMEEINKRAAEAYDRAIKAGHNPVELRRKYPQAAQAHKDMLADAAEQHIEGRSGQPELATKGLKSEVARPVPTAAQETRAAFGGGATSGMTHQSVIAAAWKSFSDALRPEFEAEMKSKPKLKRGGWEKEFDDFLKDHMIGMEDHDLSELLHNFLPPEMAPYARDIFFEKGKAGENPNLLAFLTNYKPMLPPAVKEVIGDKLAETVKVALALPGDKPLTHRAERFYARIIYNHVDNLLGSEKVRLELKRNVFKSSAPEMAEQTKWMAESIQDRHNQDREDIAEMFSHNQEMAQTALATLDNIYESLYKLNKEVFNGKRDPLKAEKWKSASDELADWMIEQSNLPESKLQLDKWNIDYEHSETYKWQRQSQGQ